MRILLLALLITTAFVACNKPVKGRNGVTYKNAAQYNDYIVNRQTSLMRKVLDFGKAAQINLDSADKMLIVFSRETTEMVTELKGMPPFKNDSAMRDAAVGSFIFYKRVFENEYKQILEIRKKADVEEPDVAIQNIVDKITREEEGYDKTFFRAQKEFARKNKMELVDNKMQKEVDKLDN